MTSRLRRTTTPSNPRLNKKRADDQVMSKAYAHFSSLLLRRITPTIATSSSTETISNGSRYR
jgi:hypothetical protein